jgi:3-hydroxybutyrate dehydrogenase
MREDGWGRIVNIASVHGQVASVNKSAYVSAKHGLIGLTKAVALETAPGPVTCNAICPGYVRSALIESQIEDYATTHRLDPEAAAKAFLGEKQPSGNFVAPSDIAALAVFLCSDAAAQITGASFPIDGGWTAQ